MTGHRVYETINFVPEWYQQQQVRRNQSRRMFILFAVLIGGLLAISAVTWKRVDMLKDYQQSIENQIRSMNHKVAQVTELQNERQAIIEQMDIYNRLARPVEMTLVSGAIAHLTPDSVFLEQFDSETEQLTRTEVLVPASESRTGRAVTRSEKYEVIEITIVGAAPNDVEIANYVGRLAGVNLFRNVKMQYAKERTIDETVIREFEITMQVPLDRDYRILDQEVADADG